MTSTAHFVRLVMCLLTIAGLTYAANADEHIDFFESRIRPILSENCYECHSEKSESLKGGLRVDTRDGLLQGGDSGPAIVPGDADESLLLKAIAYDDCFYQMPPDQKMDDQVVADFREWIEEGAIDPRRRAKSDRGDTGLLAGENARTHWAFVPPSVVEVDLPASTVNEWIENGLVYNSVDNYVLEGLAKKNLPPSVVADDRTIVRRLYFDLIGLPPTYDEVNRFVAATDSNKYESLVDELLSSQQFGERWARHWLDVARYSDTKGYVFTQKRDYKDAYKYRDWVIGAFNNDMPFDRFIKLQIAADRVEAKNDNPEHLVAMGFLTLGRRFLNNRHDIIDDRIDVVTRGFMGLTVSCARCHDHKYDPIPTADYYSLYGVFSSSKEAGNESSPLALVDKANPADAKILLRGNSRMPGDPVPRRFLQLLSGRERRSFRDGSGRLELANCIADANNPLTARVFVNRVWGHLLGTHLVDTPSDFGVRSTWPIQRKLLDYLAVQFVESGWSMKSLIREIVLSRTYRQTSLDRDDAVMADPSNALFWKANRRRLDFEGLRDAMLFVSGQLDSGQIGGPSEDITKNKPSRRRTLYAFIDRQNFPGLFRAFDVATPDAHVPKRFETTVPQQSLYLMNHSFADVVANDAVAIALNEYDSLVQIPMDEGVKQIYKQILGRLPSSVEQQLVAEFVDSPVSRDDDHWRQIGHVLLLSNEFAFLD